MLSYYSRKLVNSLVSLFIFISMLFFIAQALIPHDFTTQFALQMNRELREELQRQLGLDLPIWQQYLRWLQTIFSGSFGKSFYGYEVTELLRSVVPRTLLVFLVGTIIAFFIGQWLGKVTAWRGPGLFTGATTFTAIALYTSFPPWLSFLVVYFLVIKLGLFPPILQENPLRRVELTYLSESSMTISGAIMLMLAMLGASAILLWLINFVLKRRRRQKLHPLISLILLLGLWIGSWYIFGIFDVGLEIWRMAAIPVIVYVLLSLGETMLIMQTSMRDVLTEEYVVAAKAKGLPEGLVRDKHAARNAIIPVFSRLVVSLPYLLTGMVIIERAVSWPGMGSSLFWALYQQDMPVVLAALLIVGVLSALARFGLEIFAIALDPRVRDREFRRINEMNALQRTG